MKSVTESTSQYHSYTKRRLENVSNMIEPLPKVCQTCKTLLNSRCDLVVASPFFIVYGDASETEMERCPDNINFTFAGKEVEYKEGYVDLKYPIIKHNTFHYSNCFKSHNNFWYRFETSHPTSIRRVITLQDAIVLGRISCVIYIQKLSRHNSKLVNLD